MVKEPAHGIGVTTGAIGKADEPDEPGYGAAQDKDEQGVLSEYVAETAPRATCLAKLDKVDEEGQTTECPACGHQHIAARPDLFIDGKQRAPAIPGKQQYNR